MCILYALGICIESINVCQRGLTQAVRLINESRGLGFAPAQNKGRNTDTNSVESSLNTLVDREETTIVRHHRNRSATLPSCCLRLVVPNPRGLAGDSLRVLSRRNEVYTALVPAL